MSKVQVGRSLIEGTDQVRLYHTRILLSKKKLPLIQVNVNEISHWVFLLNQRETAEYIRKMPVHSEGVVQKVLFGDSEGEETHPAVAAVLELEGVEYVTAAGYTLVVFRGKMFSWDELEGKLLALLSNFSIDIELVNKEIV